MMIEASILRFNHRLNGATRRWDRHPNTRRLIGSIVTATGFVPRALSYRMPSQSKAEESERVLECPGPSNRPQELSFCLAFEACSQSGVDGSLLRIIRQQRWAETVNSYGVPVCVRSCIVIADIPENVSRIPHEQYEIGDERR